MIDPKLITFITVARVKNFTKTGRVLNLTQPAVSQHIKALEDYYEVKLIEKHGKQMELTEEGEILYEYAIELEKMSKVIEGKLKNKSSIIKRYHMGATLTIGGYVLPSILGKYRKIYENIDIILQVNNTEIIMKKLLQGEIQLALVEGPFDKTMVNYKKLKDDELVLAISSNNILGNRKEVSIEEVLKGNLILREQGSGTRKIFENKLISKGYSLDNINVYMEIGDINAIISLVESNLGYTIISRETIKESLKNNKLVTVPIKDFKIEREFNFVYVDHDYKEFIENFINFAQNSTI